MIKKHTVLGFVFFALVAELLLMVLLQTVFSSKCGSLCDPHSFTNPLGITSGSQQHCAAVCVKQPGQYFYAITDLFFADSTILRAFVVIRVG